MNLLRLTVLAALFGGLTVSCGACLEHAATPVTIQVRNDLDWPIYVEDDFGQLGTSVLRRDSDGSLVALRETASCACEECSIEGCAPCRCEPERSLVRRIDPGQTLTRTWHGEFREEVDLECGIRWGRDRRTTCLGDRRAAQPGAYRVQLCYAQSITGAPPGIERFEAELRGELTCATADFEHPTERVVVSTTDPAACRQTADCPTGQICQGGRCSADCLPHQVPALGGDWTVEIGGLDDRGFFSVTEEEGGAKRYQASGKVTSVRYSRGTTNLELERIGENGLDYGASLYYVLPEGRALPIRVGETLEVTLRFHPENGPRRLGRAIVLRQDGRLLLAADSGDGGPVLDATMLDEVAVEVEGAPYACNPGDCGRRTHRITRFSAAGQQMEIEAGRAATIEIGGENYELVAVGNYFDEASGCGAGERTPYAVILDRELDQP